jgi:hypothetical protein
VSATLAAAVGSIVGGLNADLVTERLPGGASLDVVEVYPYVPYIQYLLPGRSRCRSS